MVPVPRTCGGGPSVIPGVGISFGVLALEPVQLRRRSLSVEPGQICLRSIGTDPYPGIFDRRHEPSQFTYLRAVDADDPDFDTWVRALFARFSRGSGD